MQIASVEDSFAMTAHFFCNNFPDLKLYLSLSPLGFFTLNLCG